MGSVHARPTPLRLLAVIVGGSVLLSFGIGFGAATLIRSPQQLLAETAAPEKTPITAKITVGSISQSILFPGRVVNGNAIDVMGNAGFEGFAAGVITREPLAVGASVVPGTVLFEDSDRPVILLPGEVPLYRNLTTGDSGADVARFQTALEQLGYLVFDELGSFGPSTELAIRELYQALDYSTPMTEPEPVALAPEPAPAPATAPAPSPTPAPSSPAPPLPSTVAALASEFAFAPHGAIGRVTAVNAGLGDAVTADPVMSLTTAPPNVLLLLTQAEANQFGPEYRIEVTGAGLDTARGASVSRVEPPAEGEEDADPMVRVFIAPDEPLAPEQVSSRVQVATTPVAVADETGTGLLVPLAAIHSTPNGESAVTLLETDGTRNTPVQIVHSGDGLAQITAKDDAVTEGATVLVGAS